MKGTTIEELREYLNEQIYGHTRAANELNDISTETKDFHRGAAAEAAFILRRINKMHELGRI